MRWAPVVEGDDGRGLPPFGPSPRPAVPHGPLREATLLVVAAVLMALLVRAAVAQAFSIPSESMEPQLDVGDRVVVSKLSYRLHEPRRGDVVVFAAPASASLARHAPQPVVPVRWLHWFLEALGLRQPSTKEFIKRIVALPGERVEGRDGGVVVGGRRLIEPYLPRGSHTGDFGPFTVPAGSYWVMGDNRDRSLDSRSFGPVARPTLVGRAVARAWPPWRTAFL